MSFDNFSIDQRCRKVLQGQGIITPTPVQEQTIPLALEGRDIVAVAQTGTGKTLAFALPALTRLAANGRPGKSAMLVLTPTRELAIQVHKVLDTLARTMGLTSVCIYGGAGMEPQTRALRQGRNIIVATPGRLLDHMGRKNVRFDALSVLVLDEADRMLDMGFLPDVRRIMDTLPKERQTMMFSATFPADISRLAKDLQHDTARIEVGTVAPTDSVSQRLYTVGQTAKTDLLSKLLREPEVSSALVFVRTKRRTDRVTLALHKQGFKVQAIHGDRSQNQRQQALDGFRKGRYTVLVATDVAARGIDVEGISHVINFDIPNTADEYIHRIGRTGRANATGDAITFVSPDEYLPLRSIESSLGKNLPREEWGGAVSVVSLYAPDAPRQNASRSGAPRRRLLRRR
jgi:ATP-dependent RNA helicase RhlE